MNPLDKVEDYLHSVEQYFFSSISTVTQGMPDVHEVVDRLWIDISRYGPGMPGFPEVPVPSLGDFQVPPPPPPSSKHLPSVFESSVSWVVDHPWKASGIAIGVVGTGLLAGYHHSAVRQQKAFARKSAAAERRQVVVVLGGDTPHGLPLILGLEKKGYIVIASVSTPEAIEILENKCKGFVKALVLDPQEPATVPIFLRSLSSTLSRRFPLKSTGDPYSSPSSLPYIQSIVSLLTLPSASTPVLGPLEHISLRNDYLPYLNATQITPLQVIQQILPLLRTVSARSRDKGKKSIVVCLPAVETRVSLPFSSVQAMSAAGTLKAIEGLRREIRMASLTGKSDSMDSIRVVIVDVGAVKNAIDPREVPQENPLKATEGWTSSEKVLYGPAFASILQGTPPSSIWDSFRSLFDEQRSYAVARQPAQMSVFVNKIVAVISQGNGTTICGHSLGLGSLRNWVQGDRFSVGAGALTYRLASYLPSLLLDALVNLPYFLIELRNRLLPVQPFRRPPRDLPPRRRHAAPEPKPEVATERKKIESAGTEEIPHDEIETTSEPDTEGSGASGVESSWINLHRASPATEQEQTA